MLQFPATYHAVLAAKNNDPIFATKSSCNTLAYILFETAILHKYGLFAFCIMPDHTHMLFRTGNIEPLYFIELVKLRFEFALRRYGSKSNIWQKEPRMEILSEDEIISTAAFIVDNPVRNGIAPSSMEYPFSFVLGGKAYAP
jgi:REP element-mobilizing transposase RayT